MPAPTSSTPIPLDASGLFQQGLDAQSRGDLAQAERCYRMALALDRRHGPSLHMLGVLAAQVGRYEEAVELLRQAARQMPQDFAVHNNLGNAQHKGRSAKPSCQTAGMGQ